MISSRQIAVNKLYTLKGHKDCIYTLAKAEIKGQFYSAGGDGQVVKWNLANAEAGALVAKVSSSIYALNFYSRYNALIIGQNFEGIHIIDVEQKKEIGSIAFTKAAIFDIQCYNNIIIVASGEGTVTLIDIAALKIIKQLKYSQKSARTISINPVKKEFAVGYSDHSIKIFDIDDYRLKQEFNAHSNSVFTVRYSPDYKFLLSGSRDAHLNVWKVEEEYTLKESIVAHMYAINHITYKHDHKYFVTCSMDKSIKVWDAQHFKLLKVIDKARYAGHGTSVNKLLWADYENDNVTMPLISASDDRTLSVWQINFNEV